MCVFARNRTRQPSVRKNVLLGVALLLAATGVAVAEDHYWSALWGGSFNYWLNWVPNWVPGEDDNAVFELGMNPAYEVTFYESVTNQRCIFRTDQVVLNLGGCTYNLICPGWGLTVAEELGHVANVLFYNGTLNTETARVGAWAGSDGVLELVGPLTMNVTDWLFVADEGAGSMKIGNGVTVNADYLSLSAHDTGASGELVVDGPNARLAIQHIAFVGDGGAGFLSLDRGARANARAAYVGGAANAYGEMNLADGAEFVADWLALGRQGSGQLTVEGSGRVAIKDFHVGAETGGMGWADLVGSGSRIDASAYLLVGSDGQGTMNVWGGADATAETLLVGAAEDSEGELNVAGPGTTVTVLNNIQSGQFGVGAISITDGAEVRTTEPSGWIHIGREAGSEGHIFLDEGSTLAAEQAPIVVGEAGQATLAIFGGSDVHSSGELFMGWTEGSAGQLTLSGAGSTYVSDSVYPAIVGNQGTGQVTIEAGGRVEKTNGGFILGNGSAGTGTVALAGAMSAFKSPMLTVGQYGAGAFHVNDGRAALGDIDPAAVPSGHAYIAGYGQLAGTGTVAGTVVNLAGWVKPGGEEAASLTGVLTVNGDYTQQEAALAIKMKGRLAGGEYGVLNVTGTASLDGGLQLLPIEGFEPQPGDQFVVLTAANVVGTFAAKWAPVPFIVSYSPDHVTVTVLRRGDLNCDFAVNFGDINPFVLALTNPSAYAATFPDCDIQTGDIDANGIVDFGDINPFVRLLTNP